MILKKLSCSFILLWLLIGPLFLFCQDLPTTKAFTPADTIRKVEILSAKTLTYKKIDSVTKLTILDSNVRLKQGNSIFECDSCVINKHLNIFEAWVYVHINVSDYLYLCFVNIS